MVIEQEEAGGSAQIPGESTSSQLQSGSSGVADVDFEPAGPRPILRLSKDVVNQIAAAEIIHRPANAIKELIENSLDAGSTSIKVTLKEGGLKLIQITDNGHGIHKSDLPLLCMRYATSKLREFSDLQRLVTYGFRGEALASISYCAHVEVITKTRSDECGWKAAYLDGELIARGASGSAEPRPTAANDGTIINVEDLFYNMPLRKRAFKSASDEYNRVLDVITKYAVHNPHASWVCKKAGTALPDISTSAGSTTRQNISLLYTSALAKELLEVPLTTLEPEGLGAKCEGWVSNANSNWSRRGNWILFINHRLVESSKIKKAIESLYTAYLPKGASPFVYLSLEIDPSKVDVNVHPTKSEVHFLNEDEIVEGIVAVVNRSLANANISRTFTVQTLLPGVTDPSDKIVDRDRTHKPAPNYKVRMDPTNRTLDSMLTIIDPSQIIGFTQTQFDPSDSRPRKRRAIEGDAAEVGVPMKADDEEVRDEGIVGGSMWNAEPEPTKAGNMSNEVQESLCEFESIIELRKAIRKRAYPDVIEMMQRHAFVGLVDRYLGQSVFQHSTKLFIVDHNILADEHFYQLGLKQFGALSRLKLEPPPNLRDLVRLAAEDEPGIEANGLTIDIVVEDIVGLLMNKREMVDEYFSLAISEQGNVESLPLLLKGYTPNLDRLPHFLLCLGTQVNWDTEKECFESFLRELAFFYSPRTLSDPPLETSSSIDPSEPSKEELEHQAWQLEHVLFPSFRRTLWPRSISGHIKQIANLPDLFRVFERC